MDMIHGNSDLTGRRESDTAKCFPSNFAHIELRARRRPPVVLPDRTRRNSGIISPEGRLTLFHERGAFRMTSGAVIVPRKSGQTLGETLGNILKAATERADKLAQKVQASSDELHKVMDATEEVSQDMDRVTADMKTKLGLGGNGGPAL